MKMKKTNPIVLSIDPGYDRLGAAVLQKENGKEQLVYSICIETNKKDLFENRLLQIGTDLEKIIKTYNPDIIAIESLFMAKNHKTVIGVAEARGVILYLAAKYTIGIKEYTPLQIKSALTSDGKATKEQVAFMVKKILESNHKSSLDWTKKKDDELDAIACGITALATYRNI